MFYKSFDEAIVSLDLAPADQNHAADESILVFYDISARNRWQKKDRRQKKQQYQISEYTITNAYLRYWGLLRTKNLT